MVRSTASIDSLPIVELADRVRVIPLFAALSVDELFRIAEAGEEIRHPAGRELCHAATPAADVLFLLEGGARTIDGPSPDGEILPPAVIGFEDVLQGTALRSTVRAIEPTVCFRIAADDFMTMVSDNVLLAQSLFALLLANDRPRLPFAQPPRVLADHESPGAVHAARLLRHDPLLSRASATQLLALTAIAPEVPLKAGHGPLRRRHATGRVSDRSGRGCARAPWNEPGGRASRVPRSGSPTRWLEPRRGGGRP